MLLAWMCAWVLDAQCAGHEKHKTYNARTVQRQQNRTVQPSTIFPCTCQILVFASLPFNAILHQLVQLELPACCGEIAYSRIPQAVDLMNNRERERDREAASRL